MREFFDYRSPYRIDRFMELNLFERIVPILIMMLGIYLIVRYKENIQKNHQLDKRIRLIFGVSLGVLYVSHYVLRFALYQWDKILIPFQLCSIAMFIALILIATNNRKLHPFLLYAGTMGTFVSVVYPVLGYDSGYYRYYQFFIAHGILLLTPIYYLVIYEYYPTFKDTIRAFVILQIMAIFMLIFNYYVGTDFMFMFLDPDKLEKFEVIKYLGGIPTYLIWVEVLGFGFFMGMYYVIKKIYKEHYEKEEI